jgi:hypothetical protein
MRAKVILLIAVTLTAAAFAASPQRQTTQRFPEIKITVPVSPAPTGACAGSVAHCITIAWTPSTKDTQGNALTGTLTYDVLRSTTSGSGYTKITAAPTSSTTYEDDTATPGQTYYYVVVANMTIGTAVSTSANSPQASATALPIPIPNAPSGATATSQ